MALLLEAVIGVLMAVWCFSVDSSNGSSEFDSGDLVSAVTRVMVSQNRLFSDSDEVVALQVFSEVIELEGKEVSSSFTQSQAAP